MYKNFQRVKVFCLHFHRYIIEFIIRYIYIYIYIYMKVNIYTIREFEGCRKNIIQIGEYIMM